MRAARRTPAHLCALAVIPLRRSSAPRCKHPQRGHVEWVVRDEADRAGEHSGLVYGVCMEAPVVAARYRAIVRIIGESRCSILGLSKVWGVDRKSIQRALMLAQCDTRLDPYQRRSERRAA